MLETHLARLFGRKEIILPHASFERLQELFAGFCGVSTIGGRIRTFERTRNPNFSLNGHMQGDLLYCLEPPSGDVLKIVEPHLTDPLSGKRRPLFGSYTKYFLRDKVFHEIYLFSGEYSFDTRKYHYFLKGNVLYKS